MRMQPWIALLLLSSFEAAVAPAGEGQTPEAAVFHVDPAGDDAGPGSMEQPWRTVQHAADTAGAGSKVLIHAGTYPGGVAYGISGKPGSPILFAGPEDGTATVQGALELRPGISHLRLTRLTVRGFSDWGITLHGSNRHIELTHLTVIGGEAGVRLTWGDSGQEPQDGPVSDIVLAHSLIRDALYTAVDCTPGPCDRMIFRDLEITGAGLAGEDSFGADGLAVERGQEILVEDCFIHDNGGDGIDLNSRDRNGNVYGILVRRNRVVRNHLNGIKLSAGGRMENNAIWGQGDTAVVIGELPGTYELANNTVAYNMYAAGFGGRNYALVAAYPSDDTGVSASTRLILRNNIFAFNGGPAHGDPTGIYIGRGVRWLREGNNLFWSRPDEEILWETPSGARELSRTDVATSPRRSTAAWLKELQSASSRAEVATSVWSGVNGGRDLAADPRFVSGWPDVDLHLREGSPAIDAGASRDAPPTDLDGKPRGARPDLGAYEH
ncbi:MAG: right-handed parallel beta-helix repeat-containing protein [Chromatiaceae bacterium]